jgi:hypothetical protein
MRLQAIRNPENRGVEFGEGQLKWWTICARISSLMNIADNPGHTWPVSSR